MTLDDGTPSLEIDEIIIPEWTFASQFSIRLEYQRVLSTYLNGNYDIAGLAENVGVQADRLARVGNLEDLRNHWIVGDTEVRSPVYFDFQAAAALYDGRSDNGDPTDINGFPAHLYFLGGVADDTVFGGTHEDEMIGFGGDDTLNGGPGNDILNGDYGNDTLNGGEGDDYLWGGFRISGTGADTISGGPGNDVIYGGTGGFADTIDGGSGNDFIEGGLGDDVITDLFGDNLIYGSDTSDPSPLVETDNDTIITGDGNDTIFGQFGSDLIDAGNGDNQVDGGEGINNITTGSGADRVIGGPEKDTIRTGAGNDEISGKDGNDRVEAGAGDDRVDLGAGDDLARGNEGDDIILGGLGDDGIEGNDGDDVLAGNEGDDRLFGGFGNDTLWYGAGRDHGEGGFGDDRFAFDDRGGTVTLGQNLVADFTHDLIGFDTIDFSHVEALTHLSVIELDNDQVRMIGFSADPDSGADPSAYDPSLDDAIFDVYVMGENVGDDGNGILMRAPSYGSDPGPVYLRPGVFVDIGTPEDHDWVQIQSGGDASDFF